MDAGDPALVPGPEMPPSVEVGRSEVDVLEGPGDEEDDMVGVETDGLTHASASICGGVCRNGGPDWKPDEGGTDPGSSPGAKDEEGTSRPV